MIQKQIFCTLIYHKILFTYISKKIFFISESNRVFLQISRSLVVGAVINKTRTPVEVCGISVTFSDYHVAFYFFAGCMIIVIISAFMFSFPVRTLLLKWLIECNFLFISGLTGFLLFILSSPCPHPVIQIK